jgi:hypothetical protein
MPGRATQADATTLLLGWAAGELLAMQPLPLSSPLAFSKK